jgi:phosphoglycerate dehydrogenase-like enzyme
MHVRAVTQTPERHRADGELTGLESLDGYDALRTHLPWADFVVIAVPAAARTRGLFGTPELSLLRPSAFLINVGRGAVVDEAALFQALREERIAGAALDVWYQYPNGSSVQLPAENPFHELRNVIMTPHVAGWSHETTAYRWRTIAENVRRYAYGEELLNVVVPVRTNVKTGPLA